MGLIESGNVFSDVFTIATELLSVHIGGIKVQLLYMPMKQCWV